jgi:hypothetical protein
MRIDVHVPDGERGPWKVETFTITKDDESMSRIRAMMHPLEAVRAGTYKKLTRNGSVVMSNTQMEIRTHSYFIAMAQGSVLINGLGLGMALTAILAKPEVTDVTVIEKDADVIALVGPTFAADPRVSVIHADAMTWQPPRGKRYGAVWHDIWNDICADNLPEMKMLCRRYGRRTDWQGCWAREHLR